ncbi:MAG: sensor histidine kinase [Candidatus Hydrogenedentes bacterium]|nr:sensor histidine kinase [Candidatus Hydrogenedentota bacterium]
MPGSSLRHRIFAALTLLSLIPLTIVAYQGYHCGRMAVHALLEQHVLSIAASRRAMIQLWLIERERDLAALASLPGLSSALEELQSGRREKAFSHWRETLNSIQGAGSEYESLALYGPEWTLLAAAEVDGDPGQTAVDAEFRDRAASAEKVYSEPEGAADGREAMMRLSIPVRRGQGAIAGFVVARLNVTRAVSPILEDRAGLGRTGTVYLASSDKRRGAAPLAATHGSADEFLAFDHLDSGDPGAAQTRDSTFQTGDTIGATLPLPLGSDWWLVVEIRQDEAMRPVRVLLFRATVVVVVALLAVTFVSAWLSGSLGGPLANLARVARGISSGNTDARMEPATLREVEEVRSAFNGMLDDLRDKENVIVRSATLATVGELTSRVVHEMRNPLSSIKMNLHALKSSARLDADDRELAEIASGQSARLEGMLHELLQYGRPIDLNLEPFPAGALLANLMQNLRRLAAEKGIQIAFEDYTDMASVNVDVEQFSRVLENLVKNAVDASPNGSAVEIGARVHGGEVIVEVLDSGAGIRPEHRAILFKPFFTTKSDGTGLGLANAKKIVELHGGRIYAGASPQGGAAFCIGLPRAEH